MVCGGGSGRVGDDVDPEAGKPRPEGGALPGRGAGIDGTGCAASVATSASSRYGSEAWQTGGFVPLAGCLSRTALPARCCRSRRSTKLLRHSSVPTAVRVPPIASRRTAAAGWGPTKTNRPDDPGGGAARSGTRRRGPQAVRGSATKARTHWRSSRSLRLGQMDDPRDRAAPHPSWVCVGGPYGLGPGDRTCARSHRPVPTSWKSGADGHPVRR